MARKKLKPLPLPEYTVDTGKSLPVRLTTAEKLTDIFYTYSRGYLQKSLNIPASTIARIQSGEVRASAATVQRLFRFDRSERGREIYRQARESGLTSKEASTLRRWARERARNYIKLRSSGDSVYQAKGYSLADRKYIDNRSERLLEVAKKLSKKHKVKLEYIVHGMQLSDRTVDEWEEYTKARKGKR